MGKFQDNLLTNVDGLITLPLLHTCDAFSFRGILEQKSLVPQLCDVFHSNLLYTYYGLPSYRSNFEKATTIPAYYMICFILETENLKDLHKIYPFDSGAFEKLSEMKDSFFHDKTEIKEFELENSISSAKKVIKTFYETNENYLAQTPKISKEFSLIDFEAISYGNLIKNGVSSRLDDRTSSIEVIFDSKIELTKENVKQIIIPKCFKDDSKIMTLLNDNFGDIDPIGYNTHRGSPKEYFGLIRELYLNFLQN